MKKIICGLDEAGRGPLAGPVTAGAVILPEDFPFELLNDSKKLSEKKRMQCEQIIKEKALWGVGIVDHLTIDKMNILNASMYAMKLAFEMLLLKLPAWLEDNKTAFSSDDLSISVIADGNKVPPIKEEGIVSDVNYLVKADAKVHEVMAASIIAKVQRDRIMYEMDKLYPEYKYAQHKGYPTSEHRRICHEIGPSPIQRMSFKY